LEDYPVINKEFMMEHFRCLNTKGILREEADRAIRDALDEAGMRMEDIELIVCGMATPLQAIPCNAALIHERWAKGLDIPAIQRNLCRLCKPVREHDFSIDSLYHVQGNTGRAD